ncbi:MAG TPA: LmeA family phospholipid-binding protein, partial [Abditibacteriaceae bacterium]|nr:LmeA family phospholipid-binding protein [Abditibacteriaceae bacterium]
MKPSRSNHPLRWILGACCAAGILTLAAATQLWPAHAAPTKPAPAASRKISPQAQRVTAALTRVLQAKVSSPGGKMHLRVRPTARAGEGYFSEIYIAAHPATIKKKLRISELVMRARNVRLDVPHLLNEGKVRTLSSTTTLRAVITENDLTT